MHMYHGYIMAMEHPWCTELQTITKIHIHNIYIYVGQFSTKPSTYKGFPCGLSFLMTQKSINFWLDIPMSDPHVWWFISQGSFWYVPMTFSYDIPMKSQWSNHLKTKIPILIAPIVSPTMNLRRPKIT